MNKINFIGKKEVPEVVSIRNLMQVEKKINISENLAYKKVDFAVVKMDSDKFDMTINFVTGDLTGNCYLTKFNEMDNSSSESCEGYFISNEALFCNLLTLDNRVDELLHGYEILTTDLQILANIITNENKLNPILIKDNSTTSCTQEEISK